MTCQEYLRGGTEMLDCGEAKISGGGGGVKEILDVERLEYIRGRKENYMWRGRNILGE